MNRRSSLFALAPPASPLPGAELLTTEAARVVADRNQFVGGIEQHVYVNGYDLARVESAGLNDPRIRAILEQRGWQTVSDGVTWFRDHRSPQVTLADAVLAVLTEQPAPAKADPS